MTRPHLDARAAGQSAAGRVWDKAEEYREGI
jgi:hypothetical protein